MPTTAEAPPEPYSAPFETFPTGPIPAAGDLPPVTFREPLPLVDNPTQPMEAHLEPRVSSAPVTSLEGYEQRVRAYSDTYNVPMDADQVTAEATRQYMRDHQPKNVVTRMRNSWYKRQGVENDPRIVLRDKPAWHKQYQKNNGGASAPVPAPAEAPDVPIPPLVQANDGNTAPMPVVPPISEADIDALLANHPDSAPRKRRERRVAKAIGGLFARRRPTAS